MLICVNRPQKIKFKFSECTNWSTIYLRFKSIGLFSDSINIISIQQKNFMFLYEVNTVYLVVIILNGHFVFAANVVYLYFS